MARNPAYPPSSLRFDWIMAILAALLMAGIVQDGWAHEHGLVDMSFITPWHAILYSCMAINGAVLGIIGLRSLRTGYSFRRGLPFGYWTSLIGVFVFATGGVFDLIWHTLWGVEADIASLISVSHLWLALGAALVFVGPIRSIAHRYDRDAGGWAITGPVCFCAVALLTLFGFFTQYASLLGHNTSERVMAPNRDGTPGGQLYSVRTDGSRETRLATIADHDIGDAAISMDGTRIAYRVQALEHDGFPASDIYVARGEGAHAVRITHSGRRDTQVTWSPDGKRLAYVSMPAGTSGNFVLVTVDSDGSNARKILEGRTTLQNPQWSPDGTSIVFGSRNGLHPQLAIVPAKGGAIRWLADSIGGSGASWSRTGQIIFSQGGGTLALTSAIGNVAKTLKLRGSEPAFSPDGSRIAYAASADGAMQIFVADADGSHAVNVTHLAGQDASHPAWRSSDELVFTAAGRPVPLYSWMGTTYTIDAGIISSLILVSLPLLLVRRWRMPPGSMTFILGLYAVALATQNDTYWDIPAALTTGIVADILLAVLKDRARTGNGLYGFAFTVPFVMSAAYSAAVYVHDAGLGWSPNMTIGTPFIGGIIGLLVSFCFAPPLAEGVSSSQLGIGQAPQLAQDLRTGVSAAHQ